MKKDCCGKLQQIEASRGEDRRELARLRALIALMGETLDRLDPIDRAVVETKMRIIEKTHE